MDNRSASQSEQPVDGQVTTNTTARPPLLMVQTLVFALTFLVALIGVPWYQYAVGFDSTAWIAFVVYAGLTGMSITAGYHRLWSHNAYKAHPILRFLFAIFGAATVQNSIKAWVSGHRTHHRHVDSVDKDPYSARRGLWFSHMGWMLRNYKSGEEDFSNIKDLERDPIVVWQHDHYVAITLVMNFGPPLILGFITGDYLAHFLLIGVLRLVFSHHTTFFINSLAHFWGKRPYTDENSARDNGVLALVTYGEGYHNYHHKFQLDYRNGIRWFHYDPTKWLIFCSQWLGLTSDLKRVPNVVIREAQLQRQFLHAKQKLERLQDLGAANKDKWQDMFEREYNEFMQTLQRWQVLRKDLTDKLVDQLQHSGVNSQIKEIEKSLASQYRRLVSLNQMLPVPA